MTPEPYHGTRLPVGPLPTVRFHDGSRVAYVPPRDTCDIRYVACKLHHVACDCREAERAEEVGEYRNRLRGIARAAADALRGHYTYAYDEFGELDFEWICTCSGCCIARQSHEIRTLTDQYREGTSVYPCLRAKYRGEEEERESRLLRSLREERARKWAEEEPPF